MLCPLLMLAGLTIVSAVTKEDCMHISHPPRNVRCCKAPDIAPKDGDREIFDECRKTVQSMPPSCEMDECIAKKKGFLSEDGTLNKKALAENLGRDFESAPEMYEKIKAACIDGDVSSYPPPQACELGKIKHCIHIQYLTHCTDWNTDKECPKIKELAEACRSM